VKAIAMALALGLAAPAAHGQESPAAASVGAVLPADVLEAATALRAELDELARLLGGDDSVASGVHSEGAAPREVWFQARGVYRIVDRVAVQRTGLTAEPPALPSRDDLRPADVLAAVEATRARLRLLAHDLGLDSHPASVPPPRTTRPDQVLEALSDCLAQAGTLLRRPVDRADVHHAVTRSVALTARLLGQYPGSIRVASAPALREGVVDADIHRALASVATSLAPLLDVAGGTAGALSFDTAGPVADLVLAQAIEAELAWLLLRAAPEEQPPAPLPVDAVDAATLDARITLLALQIEQLTARARADGAPLRGR